MAETAKSLLSAAERSLRAGRKCGLEHAGTNSAAASLHALKAAVAAARAVAVARNATLSGAMVEDLVRELGAVELVPAAKALDCVALTGDDGFICNSSTRLRWSGGRVEVALRGGQFTAELGLLALFCAEQIVQRCRLFVDAARD